MYGTHVWCHAWCEVGYDVGMAVRRSTGGEEAGKGG